MKNLNGFSEVIFDDGNARGHVLHPIPPADDGGDDERDNDCLYAITDISFHVGSLHPLLKSVHDFRKGL